MVTKTTLLCDVCGNPMQPDDDGRSHLVAGPGLFKFMVVVAAPSSAGITDVCQSCRVVISKNDPVVSS